MTKRGKIMLLSATLLALCVIVSSIVFLSGSGGNGENSAYTTIVLYAAIGLTVLSVGLIYLWKVRRKGYEKLLDAPYFAAYEVIRDVIATSQLSILSKREVEEDVLDMLLTAQKANRPVGDVVGNPALFANDIVHSYLRPGRFVLLGLFDGCIALILYVFAVNTLTWLEQAKGNYFDTRIGISLLLFFALIAFVLLPLTRWLVATKGAWAYLLPIVFGVGFIIIMELLRATLSNIAFIKTLLDGTVVLIPSLAACLVYIAAVPLLFLIKARVRRRMVCDAT